MTTQDVKERLMQALAAARLGNSTFVRIEGNDLYLADDRCDDPGCVRLRYEAAHNDNHVPLPLTYHVMVLHWGTWHEVKPLVHSVYDLDRQLAWAIHTLIQQRLAQVLHVTIP